MEQYEKKFILILCPSPSLRGGVANYYSLVRKYFCSEKLEISFLYTGKHPEGEAFMSRIFKTLSDLFTMTKLISPYDLILFNPSLDPKSVVRDGLFHFMAKRIFRKKTIIFFRGWNCSFSEAIARHGKRLFKFLFDSDRILVLSRSFKIKLSKWGFDDERIVVETTTYEKLAAKSERDIRNIVFLSRFSEDKGCIESIKAVEMLVKDIPDIKLYMAGDGPLKAGLERYVVERNLGCHIAFTGWLEGEHKHNLLHRCGIMIFPTNYGEGMPNSILEGMGAGLVIISRPVAGIPENVEDGTNGFLVESLDPADFAVKIKYLLENIDIWEKISATNRRVAEQKYEIRNVVKRLEGHFCEVLA